jgi:hypothetical protein
MMTTLNNPTFEVQARRDDMLREARMRRLAREARQPRPSGWQRIVLAILTLRPS